ncbi:MAG: hypothetical protein R3285_05950, partial [Kiloniellales bacterium]|nr:hypothetical protein [Kiloniellales bacterium]
MKHQIGPFRRNEPQNRAGAFSQSLVGDKCHGHGMRRRRVIGFGRLERHGGGNDRSDEPGQGGPNAHFGHWRRPETGGAQGNGIVSRNKLGLAMLGRPEVAVRASLRSLEP